MLLKEWDVMMNVQQDHGHQQGQQGRQNQRDPKRKRGCENQITIKSKVIYITRFS